MEIQEIKARGVRSLEAWKKSVKRYRFIASRGLKIFQANTREMRCRDAARNMGENFGQQGGGVRSEDPTEKEQEQLLLTDK